MDVNDYINLGEMTKTIISFRESNNLNVKDAADKMGISAPYLSDIEKGNRIPSKRMAYLMASVYNLDALQRRTLFDVIAAVKGTIPYDVEDFLLSNESAMQNVLGMMYEYNPTFGGR